MAELLHSTDSLCTTLCIYWYSGEGFYCCPVNVLKLDVKFIFLTIGNPNLSKSDLRALILSIYMHVIWVNFPWKWLEKYEKISLSLLHKEKLTYWFAIYYSACDDGNGELQWGVQLICLRIFFFNGILKLMHSTLLLNQIVDQHISDLWWPNPSWSWEFFQAETHGCTVYQYRRKYQ